MEDKIDLDAIIRDKASYLKLDDVSKLAFENVAKEAIYQALVLASEKELFTREEMIKFANQVLEDKGYHGDTFLIDKGYGDYLIDLRLESGKLQTGKQSILDVEKLIV